MIKSKLNSFIGKYNLGGTIESVKLTTKDKTLSTGVISDDKTVLALVTLKDFDLEDAEFGINETAKLKSLLGVLNEDIKLSFSKVDGDSKSLKIADDETDINYTLAELEVIPKVPSLKNIPDFNLEIPLTKDFVSKFIRAKGALNEVDTFTILQEDKKTKIIIGYSPNINSNRISLEVTPDKKKNKVSEPISFSAKYFKEILVANSEQDEASLLVSDKGMAYVQFGTPDSEFHAQYYLIKIALAE